MNFLQDLTGKTPEEWDVAITDELRFADIEVYKFRDYDTSGYWVKHTLEGRLGKWAFHRDETSYNFWGNVPLATAEVIAADSECVLGCMPKQWLSKWDNRPDPKAIHEKLFDGITWVADGVVYLTKDDGYTDKVKRVLQDDSPRELRFVADPSDPTEGGKPFIFNYTFYTREALKNFVAIVKRHRLEFTDTY